MADSLWNLFLPHLNRAKEIQKPLVFGGVLSPISFAAERNGPAETAGPYGVRGRGRRSHRAEEVTRPRKRGSPAEDIPFSMVCALAENYLKNPPQAPRKKRRRADTKTRGPAPQGRCIKRCAAARAQSAGAGSSSFFGPPQGAMRLFPGTAGVIAI